MLIKSYKFTEMLATQVLEKITKAREQLKKNQDQEILEFLSAAEYPQENEFQQFQQLVRMIREGYSFIHPQDKNSSGLANFTTCAEAFEQVKAAAFGETRDAQASYAHDVPQALYKQLQLSFIDKLEKVKTFRDQKAVRKSFKLLFSAAIFDWAGENKRKLLQEIELAEMMSSDEMLEWYFSDDINSKIRRIIDREAARTVKTEMPMTEFLCRFIKEVKKYSQADKFEFENWIRGLQIMKAVSYTHLRAHETRGKLVCRRGV
mgnify:CR=1 FL=1